MCKDLHEGIGCYLGNSFDLNLLTVVLTIMLSQDNAMHSGAGEGERRK